MILDVQKELELRNRQLKAVFEITRALHELSDSDILVQKTLLTTLAIVNSAAGSLLIYDEKKEELVFRYVVGEKAKELVNTTIKPNQGIAGEAFHTGKSLLIEDISKEKGHLKSIDERTGFITRDMITVPLKSIEDKPIGVMQVLNKKDGSLNANDMQVVEIMAVLAATAIENARFQETQRLAAVATMVGNISHDLKNMLTPVVMGGKLLKMAFEKLLQSPTEEQQVELAKTTSSLLTTISESSVTIQERMKEMTNCIKGIITEAYFEQASINDSILKVIATVKTTADEKGVSLVFNPGQDIPPISLDTKQIYNALYNLIDNAISATPKGGSVTLQTQLITDATFLRNQCVALSISDTGPGIPAHVLERLFTDKAISTKPGGTGFGTRIVKNVVDSHKGKIEVASQEGKGTTFTIKLPLLKGVSP